MVDPVRFARLLLRMGEQLSFLRDRAGEDREALRTDDIRLSATKYRFVTAIEAMLDIAHHLLATELWGPADDSADAVRILGRHRVIDRELADRLAAAVGFRNVLVHGYAEVDDDRVVENLDALDEFEVFIAQVRHWSAQQP